MPTSAAMPFTWMSWMSLLMMIHFAKHVSSSTVGPMLFWVGSQMMSCLAVSIWAIECSHGLHQTGQVHTNMFDFGQGVDCLQILQKISCLDGLSSVRHPKCRSDGRLPHKLLFCHCWWLCCDNRHCLIAVSSAWVDTLADDVCKSLWCDNSIDVFHATWCQLLLQCTGRKLVHQIVTMTFCDVTTACGQMLQSLCTSLHTYHMSVLYQSTQGHLVIGFLPSFLTATTLGQVPLFSCSPMLYTSPTSEVSSCQCFPLAAFPTIASHQPHLNGCSNCFCLRHAPRHSWETACVYTEPCVAL